MPTTLWFGKEVINNIRGGVSRNDTENKTDLCYVDHGCVIREVSRDEQLL